MAPGSRGFRATIIASLCLAASGAVLFLFSRTLPIFVSPYLHAIEARHRWCSPPGDLIDREAGPVFFALFGSRYWLGDIGIGLCLFGLSVTALSAILHARTSIAGMPWLRTPASRPTFALIAFAATVFIGLVGVESSIRDLDRGYACGDGIRRTAAFLPIAFGLIGTVLAVVTGLITATFGCLPVALWRWDRERPLRSWIATLLTIPPLIGVGALAVALIPTSNAFATPALVLFAYLILAIRAGTLASAQPPQSNANSIAPA